jgi:hypothetical protein
MGHLVCSFAGKKTTLVAEMGDQSGAHKLALGRNYLLLEITKSTVLT